MIATESNPDFLNDFLDYSATILNKSSNSIKEYNYDIAHFLKFIKYKFGMTKVEDESEIKLIEINDLTIDTIEKITLQDIHAFLGYLKSNYRSKPSTLARKVSSIRIFFKYLCNNSKK
ncbi:MAG: site-specific integrase, partial [Clostridia bacterium]